MTFAESAIQDKLGGEAKSYKWEIIIKDTGAQFLLCVPLISETRVKEHNSTKNFNRIKRFKNSQGRAITLLITLGNLE
ncbi:hypothetical protein C2H96_07810 [Bacillus subtilis]|nr:hypothetical protein CJ480_07315 [Bacillus subtilis]UQZ54438.1 hypothetical protein C2H96_07810 [Bacillus subtilis]UQZ67184.1 hypothetical protein C2H97_12455 [Bacillus subtilis PY79]UQZ71596.1 hypothetical protein C2I05_14420 [Bacillus subtilis]